MEYRLIKAIELPGKIVPIGTIGEKYAKEVSFRSETFGYRIQESDIDRFPEWFEKVEITEHD